jgi:hypothetical protein
MGDKAFIRLQHEIIKAYDDHSIFAFTGEGILARSPIQFRKSGQVKLLGDIGEPQAPYSVTNKGLYIQLPLCDVTERMSGEKKKLAILNCCRNGKLERLVIMLTTSKGKGSYTRDFTSELQFGPPPRWIPDQALPAWQLHSIYIEDRIAPQPWVDNGWMDSAVHSLLMTATVPAEYGKLKLSRRFQRQEPIEGLAENEWRLALRPVVDDLSLKFENGVKSDEFTMVLGLSADEVMWCSLETHQKDSGPKYFVDRLPAILNDRWAVTLMYRTSGTSSSGMNFAHHAAIEITHVPAPRSPVTMPERPPDTFTAWLVIPPTPHCGYTLAENDMSLPSDKGSIIGCARHHGSVIVYTDDNILDKAAVVPFKSSSSERPSYLLLGTVDVRLSSEVAWSTAISQTKSDASFGFNGKGKVVGASYSRALDGGKAVYVTTWRSKDKSIADHIIKLSMVTTL